MFTIKSHDDSTDKVARRRIVHVTFTNGTADFIQKFEFSIETEVDTIKKTVNKFLDELNYVPPAITDLIPVAEPVPVEPTAAEIAKTEWDADRSKLTTLMELVRDGVFTGTEKQITDLQAKVKTGFKVTYLG